VLEAVGDLWEKHAEGKPIVITTNGVVRRDGRAVMGRGIALQAADRFPHLPKLLGVMLDNRQNHVFYFEHDNLFTFPTKHDWKDNSDLQLIARSCDELRALVSERAIKEVFLPRPGCANGGLEWKDVRHILVERFDDRFTVLDKET